MNIVKEKLFYDNKIDTFLHCNAVLSAAGRKRKNMTVREFYKWVVENEAEDYLIKILRNKDKAHLIEINDDKKEVIFYSK